MRKVIIDTNALVSFVTDRNLSQQKKIAALLQQAAQLKKTVLCHHHSMSEFIYVLSSVYGISDTSINTMVGDLISMPGIELATDVDIRTILALWPTLIADYGDAVITSLCKSTQNSAVATFDKKLIKALTKLDIAVYPM